MKVILKVSLKISDVTLIYQVRLIFEYLLTMFVLDECSYMKIIHLVHPSFELFCVLEWTFSLLSHAILYWQCCRLA